MTAPPEQPSVPGWHPDPDDPTSVRHWDGHRWGSERRPRPSWAAVLPAGSGPAPRGRRTWLWWAGGATLLAGVFTVAATSLGRGPDLPPRTLEDAAFVDRASEECRRALPALRQDRPEPGPEGAGSVSEVRTQVERAVRDLTVLLGRLRSLPVVDTERAEVDRWLDDWEAYIGVGRRYAAALARGRPGQTGSVSREGDEYSGRIFRYAVANGIRACSP